MREIILILREMFCIVAAVIMFVCILVSIFSKNKQTTYIALIIACLVVITIATTSYLLTYL